jgi:hypothetical protein
MNYTIVSNIKLVNHNKTDILKIIKSITIKSDSRIILPVNFNESNKKTNKIEEGWVLEIKKDDIKCVETDGPSSFPFEEFAKSIGKTIMVRRSGHIENFCDHFITEDIFYVDSNGCKFNDMTILTNTLTGKTTRTLRISKE